jgi:cytochrome c biogenesis protein CcmG/thiol:disulfide interchange protein DsbE
MKTLIITLCTGALAIGSLSANPLATTFEGDENLRSRLDKIQDSESPPPLILADPLNTDTSLSLEDLKGKIVVLDFWATWCGPCIASIPKNNALAKKYKDQGVIFIGVCHTRGAETMKEVTESKGIEYPVAKDVEGQTVEAYQANGFPDYYIIDRHGILRVADCANSKVEDAIKILLAEQAPGS